MRFSIITVCLNEAANIDETCHSICSQTFDDFEWIVIDGQSTDGTLEILAQYRSRIDCLVSESDEGIYDAMNKGIRRAHGDYVLFLNAGDVLADNAVLETVARVPEKDILYGDLVCLAENGERKLLPWPDVLSRNFLLRNMMPHQAAYFRRSLFETYGAYDTSYRIAGDYDLFVRLLYVHKVSSFHVPRVLAVFRIGGISSSPRQRTLRQLENHRVRKKYFPWFVYGLRGLKLELRSRWGRR